MENSSIVVNFSASYFEVNDFPQNSRRNNYINMLVSSTTIVLRIILILRVIGVQVILAFNFFNI